MSIGNPEALRKSAEQKRQRSFDKLEEGLKKLVKEKKNINFNSVAEASELSRAWLYKEPKVKARIEQLREQSEQKKKVSPKQRASDASKDALIKTLKLRLKKIEAENKGFKKQLEVVYGQLVYDKELQQKIKRLEEENKRLKNKLYSPVPVSSSAKIITTESQGGLTERVINELDALKIKPTSTLANVIRNSEEETILTAIEALKEQIDLGIVKRAGAWLSKAITDTWQPNEAIGTTKSKDDFAEWYDLAKQNGKIKSCKKEDDGWYVQENTNQWHKFEVFSQRWTLEYLKGISKLN